MTPHTVSVVVWGGLAAAGIVLAVVAQRRRWGIGTPGAVLRRSFPVVVWRAVLLLGWMWLAWHLFAR